MIKLGKSRGNKVFFVVVVGFLVYGKFFFLRKSILFVECEDKIVDVYGIIWIFYVFVWYVKKRKIIKM